MLATGGADSTLRLWDVSTGRVRQTFRRHSHRINTLDFSPDGRVIAFGGDDGIIGLRDVATGERLRDLVGSSKKGLNAVSSVCFSPDSRTIATAGWNNTAVLWDVATGRALQTLDEHPGRVHRVAFSPDGRTLLTDYYSRRIRLLDVTTRARCLQASERTSSASLPLPFIPAATASSQPDANPA